FFVFIRQKELFKPGRQIILKNKTRDLLLYLFFSGTTLLLVWISLFTGIKEIRFSDLFIESDKWMFFLISRIPRTLSLILTGAGLSIAGFVMQQMSQNKFVSPTTAGALDAARMGILFSLILIPGVSLMGRMFSALIVTFLASVVFMLIVKRLKFQNSILIPLVGIMFRNILAAIVTFFAYKN